MTLRLASVIWLAMLAIAGLIWIPNNALVVVAAAVGGIGAVVFTIIAIAEMAQWIRS